MSEVFAGSGVSARPMEADLEDQKVVDPLDHKSQIFCMITPKKLLAQAQAHVLQLELHCWANKNFKNCVKRGLIILP